MKKLMSITALLAVLGLAACSDTGVDETEVDESEVEEDVLDDSDDDEEENEIEDAGTEEDNQKIRKCCRFRRHYFYDLAYFIKKLLMPSLREAAGGTFYAG